MHLICHKKLASNSKMKMFIIKIKILLLTVESSKIRIKKVTFIDLHQIRQIKITKDKEKKTLNIVL